jgi:hypothetical protein
LRVICIFVCLAAYPDSGDQLYDSFDIVTTAPAFIPAEIGTRTEGVSHARYADNPDSVIARGVFNCVDDGHGRSLESAFFFFGRLSLRTST